MTPEPAPTHVLMWRPSFLPNGKPRRWKRLMRGTMAECSDEMHRRVMAGESGDWETKKLEPTEAGK